jgi:hypothetical protein
MEKAYVVPLKETEQPPVTVDTGSDLLQPMARRRIVHQVNVFFIIMGL